MRNSCSFGGPYTDLKLAHHMPDLCKIGGGGIVVPVNAQLVLTNRCNLDCEFCFYRNSAFSVSSSFGAVAKHEMEWGKAIEIVKDAAAMGVGSITLTGGGEPAVHAAFGDVVNTILDTGMELGLITNGVLLPASVLEAAAHPSFLWMRVSLDAARPETYAATKHCNPDTFSRVLTNIGRMVETKARARSGIILGVGFVATLDNYTEILPAAAMMKSVGVESFRVRSVAGSGLADFYGDKANIISEMCMEAEQLSDEHFAVENRFRDDITVVQHPATCPYQSLHTYIGADLNVYNCCLYAYSDSGVKGNLARQRLSEFWYSESHRAHLRDFDPATRCPTCDFTYKNGLMEYLARPDPMHVNFI